jgi:hypothetical protein
VSLPKYTIFLANPYGMSYWWESLIKAVHVLFDPAVKTLQFDGVAVLNTMGRPFVASSELLIYVLPTRAHSVVSGHFKLTPGASGATGWESRSGVTGSEVYVNGSSNTSHIANLIFHEALHNKLHLSDKQLHGTGGLAADPIHPPQTQGNIALMRTGMSRLVPQWLGGWDAASDPLREL